MDKQNNTNKDSHDVAIMYTDTNNVYHRKHYDYVRNIYLSIWCERLVIEYMNVLTENFLSHEYNLSHVIAIQIDGKLIELGDEEQ